MSFLAGTIFAFCNDEAQAFITFANFVHQPIFIKFFQGYIPDVKLRVQLFE